MMKDCAAINVGSKMVAHILFGLLFCFEKIEFAVFVCKIKRLFEIKVWNCVYSDLVRDLDHVDTPVGWTEYTKFSGKVK